MVLRTYFEIMNIDIGNTYVKCVEPLLDDGKNSNICKFSGSKSKYERKSKINFKTEI
jgi:hypothetical protein